MEWLIVSRTKATCTELYKFLNGLGPSSIYSDVKPCESDRNLSSNANNNIVRPYMKTKFSEKKTY